MNDKIFVFLKNIIKMPPFVHVIHTTRYFIFESQLNDYVEVLISEVEWYHRFIFFFPNSFYHLFCFLTVFSTLITPQCSIAFPKCKDFAWTQVINKNSCNCVHRAVFMSSATVSLLLFVSFGSFRSLFLAGWTLTFVVQFLQVQHAANFIDIKNLIEYAKHENEMKNSFNQKTAKKNVFFFMSVNRMTHLIISCVLFLTLFPTISLCFLNVPFMKIEPKFTRTIAPRDVSL